MWCRNTWKSVDLKHIEYSLLYWVGENPSQECVKSVSIFSIRLKENRWDISSFTFPLLPVEHPGTEPVHVRYKASHWFSRERIKRLWHGVRVIDKDHCSNSNLKHKRSFCNLPLLWIELAWAISNFPVQIRLSSYRKQVG